MIVIDYAPGALGHFVSQILSNTVNYSSKHASFHRSASAVDKQLIVDNEQLFIDKIQDWIPTDSIALTHSYGNLNLIKEKLNCKLIQVVVGEEIIYYTLNQHLKAMPDNAQGDAQLKQHLIDHYSDTSDWVVRENYYNQYLWLKNEKSYVNQSHSAADLIISFDNFYRSKELFFSELGKINDQVDKLKIYELFQTTQKNILDKVKLYYSVQQAVTNKEEIELPNDLTLLDQGIISGLLSDLYPHIEWQLPNRDRWFNNTSEMLGLLQ